MHGVGGRSGVVDYDADGRVGAEVLHVPFIGIGEISLVCQKQNGTVVVRTEGGSVELPEEISC